MVTFLCIKWQPMMVVVAVVGKGFDYFELEKITCSRGHLTHYLNRSIDGLIRLGVEASRLELGPYIVRDAIEAMHLYRWCILRGVDS